MAKRGRKKGQKNNYSVIPTCFRCKEVIYGGDYAGFHKKTGKPINCHKHCNNELAIIKTWRRKSKEEIRERIKQHILHIALLFEVLEERRKGR